jgi:tRNA U54 and U55 pseudouridine synthase Pus10
MAPKKKQGVYHTVALPFTLKSRYLKAKRRITKTQIFYHAKKKKSSKNPLKKSSKSFQDIIITL